MNNNLTELVCIIDESGSMDPLRRSTINNYNSFIAEQKTVPGECYLTTILFDSSYSYLCDHMPIQSVEPLTDRQYVPTGMTALMDAVGAAIDGVGARLAHTPEDERPGKVLFCIITDGCENASKEYTLESVRQKIRHQREKYSWEFLFLGANIDAEETGTSLGIDGNMTVQYAATTDGLKSAYNCMTIATTSLRTTGNIDSSTLTT